MTEKVQSKSIVFSTIPRVAKLNTSVFSFSSEEGDSSSQTNIVNKRRAQLFVVFSFYYFIFFQMCPREEVDAKASQLKSEDAEVKSELAEMKADLAEVKSDLANVCKHLVAVKGNVAHQDAKSDVGDVCEDLQLQEVKSELAEVKSQLVEVSRSLEAVLAKLGEKDINKQ